MVTVKIIHSSDSFKNASQARRLQLGLSDQQSVPIRILKIDLCAMPIDTDTMPGILRRHQ